MGELSTADGSEVRISPAEPARSPNNTCVRGCCQNDNISLCVSKPGLQLGQEIARGAESVVYAASLSGRPVAAKKPRLATVNDIDRFHQELQLLSGLEHPNIALLVAARAHPPDYMFLFDLFENGNLSRALHVLEWQPSLQQVLTIAKQLASALGYLHKKGVVHRDVKPSNILLDSSWGAHLSDFGLATYVSNLEQPSVLNWKPTGKPTGGFHKKNMVGTLLYMAPEVLKKEVQSEKSDVYAFGITINELITGVVPYTDLRTEAQAHTVLEMNYTEQQLSAAVSSGELRPSLATLEMGAPASLSSLIEQCWHNDPSQRPSFDDIINSLASISADPVVVAEHNGQTRMPSRGSTTQPKYVDMDLTDVDWSARAAENGPGAGAELKETRAEWPCASTSDSYVPKLTCGFFATQGARETMEDTNFALSPFMDQPYMHLFGVFDGHRGSEAAEFSASAIHRHLSKYLTLTSPAEALQSAFVQTDASFRRELDSLRDQKKGGGREWHPGCTAAVVLVLNDKLFVANAGDCRTILCRKGAAVELSQDHTADCVAERDRVVKAGGYVEWRVGAWRVGAAALEVTRSIGDDDLKPAVTAEPEIQEVTLSADDEFLVMASDGLWEILDNAEVVSLIKNTVKEPFMCAKRLASEAIEKGSKDNITVIVAFLRPVSTVERIY